MWVIAVLASLVILLIAVLCVPIDMALHVDGHGMPKFQLRLSWLFGLVDKEITRGKRQPEVKKEVEAKRKPGKRRWGIRGIFEILKARGLLGQSYDLVKGILSRLRIRNLVVDLRIGLDNPADTGLLFAVIGPALAFLNLRFPHQIRVQPSFEEAVLEGYSDGRVRLQPIQLVTPFLKFAFSPAAIRAVKILVINKWKRKK